MATWNSGNSSYQSGNKTLFEVQMLATPDGIEVSNTNPLPVTLGNATIEITGSNVNVTIPNTVTVNSTPENPVHVHLTEVGNSGLLNVSYMPVYGNVNIFQSNGGVINNTTPLPVTGNLIISSISSNVVVSVNNWPTTQNVSFANQSVTITGNIAAITANVVVSVNNFPTTYTVSNGYPTTQNVSFSNQSVTLSGNLTGISSNVTVLVNNFPTTQNSAIFHSNGANITNSVPLPVTAAITGTVTSTPVAGAADAFGRMRVSEGFTLGDYKHTYGIDPNFRDLTANGATVTHITNQAAARISSTSNATAYAIHQTKHYHNYMPGKSQLIKSTINFYTAVPNVTKRTGYFDDNNGIFFEQTGDGTLAFVIRTDTSGSPSDARRVTQAQWNQDTCNTSITGTSTDGTNYGKAGTWNLDISKTQIVWIDFQWLGVGRVRCGFVDGGNMIVAHEFYNSNHLPTVYMSNPNLPIRCEIRNTGATTGAYFDQICSTVISEGGYVESGIDWAITTGSAAQSVTTASGNYPLIAIRLKNNFRTYPNRVTVRMGNINVYAEKYPAYWKLIKLANTAGLTLANTTWISADTNSAVEYNLTGTAMVGGDEMDNGIVGTSSPGGSGKGTGTSPVNNPSNAKKNFIAQNIASSNSEIYVVAIQAIGGTSDVWAGIQWREIY